MMADVLLNPSSYVRKVYFNDLFQHLVCIRVDISADPFGSLIKIQCRLFFLYHFLPYAISIGNHFHN